MTIKDVIETELKFTQKYCARMAALHQNAKDEIKALEVKLQEINSRPDNINTPQTQ